jgi:hypothetical protein
MIFENNKNQSGLIGFLINAMWASAGVLLPFRLLQGWHAVTMFSQRVSPPRERGRT